MVLSVWKYVHFDLSSSCLIGETYSTSNWCLFFSSLLVISAEEKKMSEFPFHRKSEYFNIWFCPKLQMKSSERNFGWNSWEKKCY